MDRFGICEKPCCCGKRRRRVGLAAGHFLATGKPAMVYMQNSGIGNAVNPICSLLNDKVYAIPVLFVVDGEVNRAYMTNRSIFSRGK